MGIMRRFKDRRRKPEAEIDDKGQACEVRGFRCLEHIIAGSDGHVILDSDFTLSEGEELAYPKGIDIDVGQLIIDGQGHSIDASGKAPIFNVHNGNIAFINTIFRNSHCDEGAMIVASEKSALIFKDCTFEENFGRLIHNEGIFRLENVRFTDNLSPKDALIANSREMKLEMCDFTSNYSGLIRNASQMSVSNCHIHENAGDEALISNEGQLKIDESKFEANESEICKSSGEMQFLECTFLSNRAGLITNKGEMHLKSIMVEGNISREREMIINAGRMDLTYAEFGKNESCLVFNRGEMRCDDVRCHHNSFDGDALIVNENLLVLVKTQFKDNECKKAIYKNMGQSECITLNFANNLTRYLINNVAGHLNIRNTSFENEAVCESYHDILNEKSLKLDNCQFRVNHGRYVLNNGSLFFINMDHGFEEWLGVTSYIINAYKPKIKIEEKLPPELWGKRNFRYLDSIIRLDEKEIILDDDIILEDGEESIYPDGIDINRDRLIIDGQDHTIDAGGRTSIFNVRKGEVILKNIHFTNAFSADNALLMTAEKSNISVDSCSFDDSNGRVIHNLGRMQLKYCRLSGNVSSQSELLFNGREMRIESSDIHDNKSRMIFCNDEDARFEILDSAILSNGLETAALINLGNTSVKGCRFNENITDDGEPADIYNRSNLTVSFSAFESDGTTIFSDGDIKLMETDGEYSKLPEGKLAGLNEFIKSLEGDEARSLANINAFDFDATYVEGMDSFTPSPDALGFTDLDGLVHSSSNVILNADAYLEESERQTYINGIRLDEDDLVIDGDGHIISAEAIGCIFDVAGQNITLKDIRFEYSFLEGMSSIVNVHEGSSIKLIGCSFSHNGLDDGHAIYSRGDVSIEGCEFKDNRSTDDASAIYSRKGRMSITSSKFMENKSGNSGGAILNWGDMDISESEFSQNISRGYGGAIGNVSDANLTIRQSDFAANQSIGEGCGIYNENELNIFDSRFSGHSTEYYLIFNERKSYIFNSVFSKNKSKSLIRNDENAVLDISNSKFISNEVRDSIVLNLGKSCGLEKVTFDGNESEGENCLNLCNRTYARLNDIKLKDTSRKSILNKGELEVWKIDEKIMEDTVHNLGNISVMDGKCDNPFNFSVLDSVIHAGTGDEILLEDDYKLENCESYFYEGGIELDRDNLTIDGNGHIIDANRKTRIFIVTGQNITLKNIKFMNGKLFDVMEDHVTGGGAIKTVKNSSLNLINCEFIESDSEDDGGAILNNGLVRSLDSRFESNKSRHYGGAITNRNTMYLKNNRFSTNESRAAGAVFNLRTLHVDNIMLDDNVSMFPQAIFNSGLVEVGNGGLSEDLMFNVGDISRKEEIPSRPFTYLAERISEENEILLDCDIAFDYDLDRNLVNGIVIERNEVLTINGKGFAIDAKGQSCFFNISNPESRVAFKNIIFRNARSFEASAFEGKGEIHFINCRFIDNRSFAQTSLIDNRSIMKIENSQFINNYSKGNSVISNGGSMEISRCDFIINSATSRNGTINNTHELSVRDCRFMHNSSGIGGAISNQKGACLNAFNSIFNSNSSKGRGGALINFEEMIIEGCEFKSNFSDGLGGAVYNDENSKLHIKDTAFNDNFSPSSGGAISNWGDLRLLESIFENNATTKDGGAIYGEEGSMAMKFCQFSGNAAKDGAAIFNWRDLKIIECSFKGNSAKKSGGALNIYDGKIDVSNTLFTGNSAMLDGGAIYAQKGKLAILKSRFESNTSKSNGGAIISWSEADINESEFTNNCCAKNGGALNNQRGGRIRVSKTVIAGNVASDGGGIYTVVDGAVKLEDCRVDGNRPNDVI